jgi:collagenase-like PrtC family protease
MKLMVGNLWTDEFLDACIRINESNPKARIAEMYGSQQSVHNPVGSARPDSRIPDVDMEFFERYIGKSNDAGIDINYTINTSCVGDLFDLEQRRKSKIDLFLRNLEELGVKRVTVAHPLIGRIVSDCCNLAIEVSTIMQNETVGQLAKYQDMMPNVDKICMSIYKNRDFRFLEKFKREADKLGIIVELLANEFCSIGGIPCHGLYRTSCYAVHSHGGNDQLSFDGYPIKGKHGCITSRIQSPASYLKARFILPQWYDKYFEMTGIDHFKISGRTHTFEQIMPVIEAYTSGNFDGNLMDLWLLDKDHAHLNIDAKALEGEYFLDQWTDGNTDFACHERCGVNCSFCDDVFERICPDVKLHRPEMQHNVVEKIGIE